MMKGSHRIAGLVVLYNPDPRVLQNIHTYLHQVEVLFAVDNSEVVNPAVVEHLKHSEKIIYIPLGENLGIAKALNVGAEKALQLGYDFLLTVDQDSRAEADMVDKMLRCLEDRDISNIGILTPFHCIEAFPSPPPSGLKYKEELTTITSGNLLSLKAFREVGPFLEELFIDYVDFEYCLRLNFKGFKIMTVYDAWLHHKWGNAHIEKFLFKRYKLSNHSYIRRYYITRNRFYVSRMYKNSFPKFYRSHRKLVRPELFQILLLEEDRFRKLKMFLKGYWDYKKGKLGKLREES